MSRYFNRLRFFWRRYAFDVFVVLPALLILLFIAASFLRRGEMTSDEWIFVVVIGLGVPGLIGRRIALDVEYWRKRREGEQP